MGDFEKLELSTETLRELTDEQLEQVAGGARPTLEGCRPFTWDCGTLTCPSWAC